MELNNRFEFYSKYYFIIDLSFDKVTFYNLKYDEEYKRKYIMKNVINFNVFSESKKCRKINTIIMATF